MAVSYLRYRLLSSSELNATIYPLSPTFAFTTVLYVAQTLIIAQRYVPLAVLWGSTRGGYMGSGIRFDFCAHYRLWLACALCGKFVGSLVFFFVSTERDEGANLHLYIAVV